MGRRREVLVDDNGDDVKYSRHAPSLLLQRSVSTSQRLWLQH
jgi:hypothetical protein